MPEKRHSRNPSLHSTHRYHELVAIIEVDKDGEDRPYYIVTDHQGCYTWKREALLELIAELQRTVTHITDEELLEEEKNALLTHSPSMFPQIYGEHDPLWLDYLTTHPELVKPARTTREPHPGFVYVIQCHERYKIGYSKSPNGRIKIMGVKSPYPFVPRLLIPTEDMEHLEATLHQRFAAQHLRGEWFALTAQDLTALAAEYPTVDHTHLSVR